MHKEHYILTTAALVSATVSPIKLSLITYVKE